MPPYRDEVYGERACDEHWNRIDPERWIRIVG